MPTNTAGLSEKDSPMSQNKPEDRQADTRAQCRSNVNNSSSINNSSNGESLSTTDKKESTLFTEHILGQDGVFVLRLIALNVGRHVAASIAHIIWTRFKQANDPGQQLQKRLSNINRGSSNQSATPPLPARSRTPSNQSSAYQRRLKHAAISFHSPPSILTGLLDNRSPRSPSTDMSVYRSRRLKSNHPQPGMEQEELIDRSSAFDSNSHDSEIQILDTVDTDNSSRNMV